MEEVYFDFQPSFLDLVGKSYQLAPIEARHLICCKCKPISIGCIRNIDHHYSSPKSAHPQTIKIAALKHFTFSKCLPALAFLDRREICHPSHQIAAVCVALVVTFPLVPSRRRPAGHCTVG
jgi:hypothetical protein